MFLLIADDKKNSLKLREANREMHLAWIQTLGARVKLAGPKFDDDGNMNGSVFLLDYDSREEVENVMKNDPYLQAGLFENIQITPFKVVVNHLA